MKIADRLWKNPGNPLDAPIAAIDPEKGDLVIDTSTPALWQKTTDRGDNSGYQAAGIGSGMTAAQQAQALENLGGGKTILHINHEALTVGTSLAFGKSINGRDITPIGSCDRYVPPVSANGDDGVRDPAAIEYEPTGEIIIAYTHVSGAASGFEVTLGLCKTSDPSKTPTFVGEIPVAGTGITPTGVWVGDWYVEDGRYYLTCLPFDGVSWDTPGVGYIECLNPGTWTSWSNFVSLVSTNANLTAGDPYEFNDVKVFKIGSTYHYLFDGYPEIGEDKTILHSTSTTLWTGLTTPTVLSAAILAGGEYEGPIFAEIDGTYYLWVQLIYTKLFVSTSTDLTTWTTPVECNWPGFGVLGNGSVIVARNARLAEMVLNAPQTTPLPQRVEVDSTVSRTGTRVIGDYFGVYMDTTLEGVGVSGSALLGLQLAKAGSVVNGGITGDWSAGTLTSSGGNVVCAASTINRLIMQNASGLWYAPAQVGTELGWYFNSTVQMTLTATGALALKGGLTLVPPASATPSTNGDLVIEATSNTSLTFKLKGSDGTVRVGSVTLS